MCGLPSNMKNSLHKTWQTSLLFLKPLEIQNLRKKSGGTWHIMFPRLKKWGGHVPRVPTKLRPFNRSSRVAHGSSGRAWTLILQRECKASVSNRDGEAAVGQAGQKKSWGERKRINNNTIVTNYACFCSPTTLTSKTITKIIENRFEFSRCANSCNKFISNRSWQTMKLSMILLWKGTTAPVSPLFK